ncbi:YcxB family protein [Acidovorax sp. LjRoot118]|uniref:YcxB family protein n=1 Tax=Acidovorax sp. LjRoot118 TaxID=3342256 RepID=UPI003ED15B8B
MAPVPFTLTRADFAALQQRVAALGKRPIRGGRKLGGLRLMAARLLVWLVIATVLFSMFKVFDSPSLAPRYIACGAFGAVLAFVLAAACAPLLAQRAIADGGWFLSPQSVVLSEVGVLQQVKGGCMQWEWSAFMAREESSTMHYLFIEPGQCVLLPKAALQPEAHALIRRHVPAKPAAGQAAPENSETSPSAAP